MKHNNGFTTDTQTDPVLPGWMGSVLFNFDEPEETMSFINAVASIHASKTGRVSHPQDMKAPTETMILRGN